MVFPALKKWAQQNNWVVGKNNVYGEYNGYYFTAFDSMGSKCFSTFLPFLNESQRAGILENLNLNKKHLRIFDVKLENGVLKAIFMENWRSLKQEEMKKYLDHVTNALKEEEVSGNGMCSRCGKESSHEMVLVNKMPVSMCRECFDHAREESLKAEQEFAGTDKKYASGLIGALAGGIAASIPWIIPSYLGWFVAFLGFIIDKASLAGYKMLGGRLGRATRWIILGATAFSIVFAELVTFTIKAMVTFEIPITLNFLYAVVLTIPEIIIDLAPGILLGLLMGFLGIFRLFRDIKQEIDSTVVSVEKEQE